MPWDNEESDLFWVRDRQQVEIIKGFYKDRTGYIFSFLSGTKYGIGVSLDGDIKSVWCNAEQLKPIGINFEHQKTIDITPEKKGFFAKFLK